jgi:prepilin-type processing-associated H-X9-DG protein
LKSPDIFYCGSNPRDPNNNDSVDHYQNSVHQWPYGGFDVPGAGNPGYVRAGYHYFPQNKALGAAVVIPNVPGVGNVALPVVNAQSTDTTVVYAGSQPINKWNVVTPMKDNAVDPSKAIVSDDLNNSSYIFHRKGNNVAGLNVVFGDGHVRWQEAKANPTLFDKNGVWKDIDATPNPITPGAQVDLRYLMYSWQP